MARCRRRERLAHLVRLGVDPAHRAVAGVRDPHRALADRDAGRRGADRDRVGDRAVLEVQARHDAAVRLGDPQAPEPDRARAGTLPQRGGELEAPVLRVHARDRVRSDVHGAVIAGREQRDRDGDEREHRHDRADDDPTPRCLRRRRWRRRERPEAFDRVHPSGTTRTTTTGSAMPLNDSEPRSSYRTPSIRRARWVTSRVARISPARAWPQSRAARFSAPPR